MGTYNIARLAQSDRASDFYKHLTGGCNLKAASSTLAVGYIFALFLNVYINVIRVSSTTALSYKPTKDSQNTLQ